MRFNKWVGFVVGAGLAVELLKGTAQIGVEISFKGFWAVSLALKVVSLDMRHTQGSRS